MRKLTQAGEQSPANLMKTLDISRAEAIEVINADKAIDKGVKLFELSEEQKAVERTMKQADRKKNAVNAYGKKVTRERKADNDKREIIQCIDDALCDLVDNVEVINPEREILLYFNDKKYKLVLSAPRS